jgi:hypothetical protein
MRYGCGGRGSDEVAVGTQGAHALFGVCKLHRLTSMKRRAVAALWITGATVPLLMATVLVVGCCALPFHHVVHKLMPICDMALSVMRGGSDADAVPASPSREKQEPVKRIATEVPHAFRLARVMTESGVTAAAMATSYRSFITLGAMRCDRDVGLHLLVETFLI